MDFQKHLAEAIDAVQAWQAEAGPFEQHPSLRLDASVVTEALGEYTERLRGNYPFHHPRYAGQMLKPPHPAAVVGYLAAQLINPNNHALDGGPPTSAMEKEVVQQLRAMLGFPEETLGHLTSGGTVANLEALWVARESHPSQGVAYSAAAHYTHGRMSDVLGLAHEAIACDASGRMDLGALAAALRSGRVGTVVLTSGTTGIGAVDPIADAIPLCREHGARVHIDGAYGGFFALLAGEQNDLDLQHSQPPVLGFPAEHFRAIAEADSVAIDPHKHGLQPYGCGAILFRDPAVGRFYRHDSPYTYFTSDDLHLGEISLECSRAGAAAGALWLTLRLLPLEAGLGSVLAACLRAARAWHALLEESDTLAPLYAPELDIIAFAPRAATASAVDAAARTTFDALMDDASDPIFLSLYRVEASTLPFPCEADVPHVRVLRSVLMKPEHESFVPHLHARVEGAARAALSANTSA